MPEYRWFKTDDGREVYRRVTSDERARSELGFPMVISDQMAPAQSMADGKVYESKRAMLAATRAAGCIEVGNEKQKPFVRPRPDRRQIKQAIEKATARYERGERVKP